MIADRELLVRSMTWEAEGVLSVVLVDPDGGELPAWDPGAHIDVVGPGGLVRQYSLCSDPGDRSTWRIGVLSEVGSRGGSAWVHSRLRPGDLVPVGGPRNTFPLTEHGRYLFIAGGIGITPLLPMIAAVRARDKDWRLVHGGRREAADGSFEVEVASSGVVIAVETGVSIIEALEARGIVPRSSCQEGTCGTCETKVLAGVPEHRDSILDEYERASGETMIICVGRSRTPRLVLDL